MFSKNVIDSNTIYRALNKSLLNREKREEISRQFEHIEFVAIYRVAQKRCRVVIYYAKGCVICAPPCKNLKNLVKFLVIHVTRKIVFIEMSFMWKCLWIKVQYGYTILFLFKSIILFIYSIMYNSKTGFKCYFSKKKLWV